MVLAAVVSVGLLCLVMSLMFAPFRLGLPTRRHCELNFRAFRRLPSFPILNLFFCLLPARQSNFPAGLREPRTARKEGDILLTFGRVCQHEVKCLCSNFRVVSRNSTGCATFESCGHQYVHRRIWGCREGVGGWTDHISFLAWKQQSVMAGGLLFVRVSVSACVLCGADGSRKRLK